MLALAAFAFYAALLLIPLYTNSHASDFAEFYYPAALRLVTGSDPYTVSFYVQPPALLFIFAPLTALPPEPARAVWLMLESAMLVGGVIATLRALDFRLTDWRAAVACAAYLSPDLAWGLVIGQSAILIFFLQALGLWALRRDRPLVGGLFLGSAVLKPHMLAVELPILVVAPRRAWLGAGLSIIGLLLVPELLGMHLLGSFLGKLLPEVSQERYNKLNPADMFVNLGGDSSVLHVLGWALLAALAALYLALIWRLWRARRARLNAEPLFVPVQQGMVAAYLWLPYTLAYDLVLVAGSYLWRFRANGYRLDRPLFWNLALLWLLPVLTLALHALGIASTLNPLLPIGLLLLLRSRPPRAADRVLCVLVRSPYVAPLVPASFPGWLRPYASPVALVRSPAA